MLAHLMRSFSQVVSSPPPPLPNSTPKYTHTHTQAHTLPQQHTHTHTHSYASFRTVFVFLFRPLPSHKGKCQERLRLTCSPSSGDVLMGECLSARNLRGCDPTPSPPLQGSWITSKLSLPVQ